MERRARALSRLTAMTGQGLSPHGLPAASRCLVMGVVNVTPDSFSDGGLWFGADEAIAHGLELAASGADIVDGGGESSRPGAQRISEAEELRRIEPVVAALAASGVVVSIDTMRARVAERALAAGARLVNDVSGGLSDPDMTALIAESGVPYVVMHWRGQSVDMDTRALYTDVVAEVAAELTARITALVAAGVDPGRLIVDPGLGFAKQPAHNWALLGRLREAGPDAPRPFAETDDATIALTALAATAGAWCVRVHAVPGNVDAVRVAARWQEEAGPV